MNRYAASYQGRRFVRRVRHYCTHAAVYEHPETGEMDASFHTSEALARRAKHYYWRDRSVDRGHAFPWIRPCAVVPAEAIVRRFSQAAPSARLSVREDNGASSKR